MSDPTVLDPEAVKLELYKLFRVDDLGDHPKVDHVLAEKLINTLGKEDLADCLFTAATIGNTPLMNALWGQRGPIQVEYDNEDGATEETLNGQPFTSRRLQILRNCNTPRELKTLFDTIMAYRMKGLIEPGLTFPFIFRKHDFVGTMLMARQDQFKGELPFLDAGVVNSPELALGLTGESARSSTPNAYQPILCWATEAMISEFGAHLAPMRPLQKIVYEGTLHSASQLGSALLSLFEVSMEEFKAGARKDGDGLINSITLGVEPHEHQTHLAGLLLHYMGGMASAYGFADPQGRVLCETRADFLMQFPLGECSEKNLKVCEDFVGRYCPVDIISNQASLPFDDSTGATDLAGKLREGKRATMTLPLYRIMERFGPVLDLLSKQSEIHDLVLNMMTRDQWKLLIDSSNKEFDALTLIAIRDALGVDNQGMSLEVPLSALDELHAAGYRFCDDTLVVFHHDDLHRHTKIHPDVTVVSLPLGYGAVMDRLEDTSEANILEESKRLHRLCQAMNLWVSPLPKPKSIAHALDEMSYRQTSAMNTEALALCAYLTAQGIDACANIASLATHWRSITQIFPPEEVIPYLPRMPHLAKGKFLESELGL